ncbi:MAG: ferritin-like domain-containing protein [Rhodothermus sp.]|nr:ferritin-like domain-containing protein [Rhodothermus sp.]
MHGVEKVPQVFEKPMRSRTDVRRNPIGLPRPVVEQLLPHLDAFQASLWVLYHQYHKHHWLVEGATYTTLARFFQGCYRQVHEGLDRIAERITLLGGVPTCHPEVLVKRSFLAHEPEGVYTVEVMLQHDLRAERELCIQLRGSIALALELNEHGTRRLLEEVLQAAEARATQLAHLLGNHAITE